MAEPGCGQVGPEWLLLTSLPGVHGAGHSHPTAHTGTGSPFPGPPLRVGVGLASETSSRTPLGRQARDWRKPPCSLQRCHRSSQSSAPSSLSPPLEASVTTVGGLAQGLWGAAGRAPGPCPAPQAHSWVKVAGTCPRAETQGGETLLPGDQEDFLEEVGQLGLRGGVWRACQVRVSGHLVWTWPPGSKAPKGLNSEVLVPGEKPQGAIGVGAGLGQRSRGPLRPAQRPGD